MFTDSAVQFSKKCARAKGSLYNLGFNRLITQSKLTSTGGRIKIVAEKISGGTPHSPPKVTTIDIQKLFQDLGFRQIRVVELTKTKLVVVASG